MFVLYILILQEKQIEPVHEDPDQYVCGFIYTEFIVFVQREHRRHTIQLSMYCHSVDHALLYAVNIQLVLPSSSSYVFLAHPTKYHHQKLHEEDDCVRMG